MDQTMTSQDREIETVAIVGLGALGILYGHHLAQRLPVGNLRIVADPQRIERYQRDGVFCNGERCHFLYVSSDAQIEPADLVIFAVKNKDLPDAIRIVRHQVGPQTIIISVMNGITSEEVIARTFGAEKLLYCTAQGMSAVKVGNQQKYDKIGSLFIGEKSAGVISDKARRIDRFLDRMGIPHEVATDMLRRLWSKFMLNVGVNQVVAVYEGTYRTVQQPDPARDLMIAAMREVIGLAEKEGIDLQEADITWWLRILDSLDPEGKPSLRQDLEAGRNSEVDLFAGTILALGQKHGLATPVNQMLYEKITAIESRFNNQ
jgi:2-dehydropantoate 2-reductase